MGTKNPIRRLLTLHGSPHGIALGMALGVGLSLVPVPVVGMIVALALAPVLRANPVGTYIGTTVVNPISGPIFYFMELWVGMLLLGRKLPEWSSLEGFDGRMWCDLFVDALRPFLVGVAVVAPVGAGAAYLLTYLVMRWWRRRRPADAA